jgi:hypothetical protein
LFFCSTLLFFSSPPFHPPSLPRSLSPPLFRIRFSLFHLSITFSRFLSLFLCLTHHSPFSSLFLTLSPLLISLCRYFPIIAVLSRFLRPSVIPLFLFPLSAALSVSVHFFSFSTIVFRYRFDPPYLSLSLSILPFFSFDILPTFFGSFPSPLVFPPLFVILLLFFLPLSETLSLLPSCPVFSALFLPSSALAQKAENAGLSAAFKRKSALASVDKGEAQAHAFGWDLSRIEAVVKRLCFAVGKLWASPKSPLTFSIVFIHASAETVKEITGRAPSGGESVPRSIPHWPHGPMPRSTPSVSSLPTAPTHAPACFTSLTIADFSGLFSEFRPKKL